VGGKGTRKEAATAILSIRRACSVVPGSQSLRQYRRANISRCRRRLGVLKRGRRLAPSGRPARRSIRLRRKTLRKNGPLGSRASGQYRLRPWTKRWRWRGGWGNASSTRPIHEETGLTRSELWRLEKNCEPVPSRQHHIASAPSSRLR